MRKLPKPITIFDSTIDRFGIFKYENGCRAVEFFTDENEPYARLSVNIPAEAHQLHSGEFFLKNYSENAPIAQMLLNEGYIVLTGAIARSGYVECPVAKLSDVLENAKEF